MNGISFELSDRANPADQALKAAVIERKAGVMADAANLKLVRLVSLSTEESRPIPCRPIPTALAKAAVPIMAGQQQISADVTAVFEIAPK